MAVTGKLRWTIADVPHAQGALFDEPIFEREPGRGEFRGMEFLHVRAKTIINEVPAASRMPFRFTINAYRGCSHACTYCTGPDTPVLLAEGRQRRIADLRPGDEVVGTQWVGRYRRYVATPVLDHWSTVKPAWRVTLDDGTCLIASGDHRFLTERGWKHVFGTEWGAACRPHLTTNNSLLGIGPLPLPPKDDDDYRRGYLCGMVRGDGTIGHRPYLRRNGASWVQHQFRLALTDAEPLDRTQQFLADAGVATGSFAFSPTMRGIRTQAKASVEAVEALIAWPTNPTENWRKGFLAGIYDAEGHLGQVIRISNRDTVILDWVSRSLTHLGFRTVVEPPRPDGVRNVRFHGGLPETMRFILAVDPATTRKRQILGRAMKGSGRRRVVAVEPLGVDIPMYDITTGTGDFIADGVVSHNCFARPTHEYLDLGAGRDFEQKIVVKVNAVERLRYELDPRRWSGDHIAMGTNTDPYQRCEGKYRLTQGLIEVLAERRNSFSILTKSTLVLRDLDLLAAAAERTDVRVNLSIGTLDESVWRATEPGTPHPLRRVEAVRRLNEAGIPCGVLVAPVLPGLSDAPEQLRAVGEACARAGAVSVSTVLLHLRPGVKEVFLESLEASHPDLVERYRTMYPRSYAPKAEQRRVAALVGAAVRANGSRQAPLGDPKHLTGHERGEAETPPPARSTSTQLHLL